MKIKPIIIGILLIWIIFCSCEGKIETNSVSALTVIAKGTVEGISLDITNIPEDATNLTVYVYLEVPTTMDEMSTMVDVHGNELEQLRKTGKLVCPFVKNGWEYRITVISVSENEYKHSSITAVANGGIYLTNKPTLLWNNENNSITLSAKPMFSEEKFNYQNNKFGYGVVIRRENGGSGNRSYSNDFTFDVSQMMNEISEANGLTGELSVFSDITVLLEYEKINWQVFFAKTEDVIVTL